MSGDAKNTAGSETIMKKCDSCGTQNVESAQFCDECGIGLNSSGNGAVPLPNLQPNSIGGSRGSNVTSIGIPPLVDQEEPKDKSNGEANENTGRATHARLIIERGDSANTIFSLSAEESNIGRWDADNGIFPDIDLDPYDPEAKVSRRHARIIFRNNVYMIEDLGSTNGTFVNRGRRLIPGAPQVLTEGDEIIVGKTFLRFHINS